MKLDRETNARVVVAPALAALQVHADVVENLPFIINDRGAEQVLTHHVCWRVQ